VSIVDELFVCPVDDLFWVVDGLMMILAFLSGFVVGFGFSGFSMESLILAQDERWRRA
jgi:hypothetical protein